MDRFQTLKDMLQLHTLPIDAADAFLKRGQARHWPMLDFPFPFRRTSGQDGDGDLALTLVELRMIKLSYALRSKKSWWTKIKDPIIRSKWREEALERVVDGETLEEQEVDYVFEELDDYALMRDEETGIQPSCYARIWEADQLISKDLRSQLQAAVAILENVPEGEKDWHPRSNNQVLDLVHPSLFCAVYDRTQRWSKAEGPRTLEVLDAPDCEFEDWAYSEKFCWIPTDFQVGQDGVPAKALDYINNIHPQHHKDLIPVVEALVGRFSLLWDKVLTDIHPRNHWNPPGSRKVLGIYKWEEDPEHPQPDSDDEDLWETWKESRTLIPPTVPPTGYKGSGQDITRRNATYTIHGKKVQVIVKLANIYLTPEKPTYPGGSWHVEGMANEGIVASGIYYYDSANITESELGFRMAVSFDSARYEQSDDDGIRGTWGLEKDEPSNQNIGSVKTSVNRCIAFPNIYQHRVSSFKLVDPTKPGYRKIVALFLIDPENRIPSTSDIPPQQAHWAREVVREGLAHSAQRRNAPLPAEVADMIAANLDNTITLEEAKAYREELMDERTEFVGVVDLEYFSAEFNFCEH